MVEWRSKYAILYFVYSTPEHAQPKDTVAFQYTNSVCIQANKLENMAKSDSRVELSDKRYSKSVDHHHVRRAQLLTIAGKSRSFLSNLVLVVFKNILITAIFLATSVASFRPHLFNLVDNVGL